MDTKIYYGNEPSQFGILWLPEDVEEGSKFPLVVMFHGGFWKSEYGLDGISPLACDLAQRGCATWNVEYRRVGEPGGGWPGTFDDAETAVNFVPEIAKKYPIDPSRVVILGHSAGGHLALWLASRVTVRAVIAMAGIPDLTRMRQTEKQLGEHYVLDLMGGEPEEFPDRYQEASPAESKPGRILCVLFHGDRDVDVPTEQSIEYSRRQEALGENVQLHVLPDTDHFDFIDPRSAAWNTMVEAVVALTK
jgi:acetyl esterase/lipase